MLPLPGGPELETQRNAIQEEIIKREKWLLDAKRQLNSLVAILQLPPELLSEILLHYVQTWIDDSNSEDSRPAVLPYGWMKVTHVCHHWREVALHTPRLWSNIADFGNTVEFVEEMISRSGQAGLFATVNSDDVAFAPVMAQIQRVAWLNVEFHDQGDHPTVVRSAPKLTRIAVTLCSCFRTDHPCLFRDSDLPKLTHLDLDRASFMWCRPLIRPTVTHLSILSADRVEPRFGMRELLAALEGLPVLEELFIQDAIPHEPLDEVLPAPLRVLPLSRLERLYLDDDAEACAALLLHVCFPNTVVIRIEARNSSTDIDASGMMELAKALSVKLSESISPDGAERRLATMSVNFERGLVDGILSLGDVRFRGWRTKHHVSAFGSVEETLPASALEVVLKDTDDAPQVFFECFFALLPLATVETLYLSHPPHPLVLPSLPSWREMLQAMPYLSELGLGPFVEDVVPDFLSLRCWVDPHAGGKGEYVLPALKVLSLHEVAFRTSCEDPGDTALVDKYRDVLRLRREAQCPLDKIVLDRCVNVTPADVALLQPLVEVQWTPEDVKHVDRRAEGARVVHSLDLPQGLTDITALVLAMLQQANANV